MHSILHLSLLLLLMFLFVPSYYFCTFPRHVSPRLASPRLASHCISSIPLYSIVFHSFHPLQMFVRGRDRLVDRDRPRIRYADLDLSPSRRPSESKYRASSKLASTRIRRACTNQRVALGTIFIVVTIVMAAMVIRIRIAPIHDMADHMHHHQQQQKQTDDELRIMQMAPLSISTTTTCPPIPECATSAPCACAVCATCPVTTCPDCPACPACTCSRGSADVEHLRTKLQAQRTQNADLRYQIQELQKQLKEAQEAQAKAVAGAGAGAGAIGAAGAAEIAAAAAAASQAAAAAIAAAAAAAAAGASSSARLETGTAPPHSNKAGQIGAGDPYEVQGEDAVIALDTHLVPWTYCTTPNGKLVTKHNHKHNKQHTIQETHTHTHR
jgi:hypothetical protein